MSENSGLCLHVLSIMYGFCRLYYVLLTIMQGLSTMNFLLLTMYVYDVIKFLCIFGSVDYVNVFVDYQ